MCGIVGYIGRRNAASVIVGGLKKLEYRGYDSFGVATTGSGVQVVKKKGRISECGHLAENLTGNCGIGHTRWATHGVPDDINAHPHTDCSGDFAIVHNGIIENYMDIRRSLESEGHVFKSDTDSEVIAHLIEKFYEGDLLSAVFRLLPSLDGAYAFLAVAKDENRIVAARNSSPLVIGIGDDEYFASSDMTPVLEYTQKMIFPEDGDVMDISAGGISVYSDKKPVVRPEELVEWDIDSARKGGYDHFMLKEIFEQPSVFYETFYSSLPCGEVEVLKNPSEITVIACGTSYHAGMVFRYLMEKCSSIPVRVDIASECRYFNPRQDSVVITVSQSGETADTIAALKKAKAHGCRTIAITNVLGSSITRIADSTFYTRAGPEISVAATKSFIAQVAIFMKIADLLCECGFEDEFSDIYQIIEDSLLTETDDAVSLCSNASNLFFVGRGLFYPVSLEGALKMKEITYIHAEGYAAGELKHGPFSLLCENTPVVALCTGDESRLLMLSNIKEIKARGAPVIGIGSVGDQDLEELSDVYIPLPKSSEISEVITSLVVLQLLAYRTAVKLGRDVDKPRNLAKSVTVI
ncbi:glutamine--fructose-6-phosphate transaminase (isomerizing) [Methanoplanus sp. FWC-SCC4]|uniref:Glutamine--fructose-6-phosphate aminotransferase [isomerizing] n=1 Tax=Methanochimaera problematica TaxID=2609417 RepID=A0AA97FFP1_9EURY|nr:glutamine--fructose-6-phosphate transaminase (isomerizing) [Methanoplanus sp. FWC-SCC4]WOF16596.1 glutamine--fructose-6-phosphate transaminase (isomerizing) [Methanoplanus sp. FWC-SCC4]